jgi:hypothetical protein
MAMATRSIAYDTAVELLQQPGHVLIKTFVGGKRGREFLIVGANGGTVSEVVAARLLARPDCHSVDPGLLPEVGQTFTLCLLELRF